MPLARSDRHEDRQSVNDLAREDNPANAATDLLRAGERRGHVVVILQDGLLLLRKT